MIEAEVFAEYWQAIVSRFNREVDEEEANRYYSYLTRRLDTDQFMVAADRLWADSARFPKPNDFLEHAPPPTRPALPGADEQKDAWWQPVLRVVSGSKAAGRWYRQFADRQESVPDHTGPPYFFPRPVIEFVSSREECGPVYYRDRPDLRLRGRNKE